MYYFPKTLYKGTPNGVFKSYWQTRQTTEYLHRNVRGFSAGSWIAVKLYGKCILIFGLRERTEKDQGMNHESESLDCRNSLCKWSCVVDFRGLLLEHEWTVSLVQNDIGLLVYWHWAENNKTSQTVNNLSFWLNLPRKWKSFSSRDELIITWKLYATCIFHDKCICCKLPEHACTCYRTRGNERSGVEKFDVFLPSAP